MLMCYESFCEEGGCADDFQQLFVWHVCCLVGQPPLYRTGFQIRGGVCWQRVEILRHQVGILLEICFLDR